MILNIHSNLFNHKDDRAVSPQTLNTWENGKFEIISINSSFLYSSHFNLEINEVFCIKQFEWDLHEKVI